MGGSALDCEEAATYLVLLQLTEAGDFPLHGLRYAYACGRERMRPDHAAVEIFHASLFARSFFRDVNGSGDSVSRARNFYISKIT